MTATRTGQAHPPGKLLRQGQNSRRPEKPAAGKVSRERLRIRLGLLALALGLLLASCQQPQQSRANGDSHLAGAELYHRLACHGCHRRHGSGGTLGPALDDLEKRLSRAEVAEQLLTPGRRHGESRMPTFAFVRPQELENLLNFLQPAAE